MLLVPKDEAVILLTSSLNELKNVLKRSLEVMDSCNP